MKYVCIDNKHYERLLNIGEIYDINVGEDIYLLNTPFTTFTIKKPLFDKLFKPLSEVREEKIKKILE